jgi:hypothetical protein
MSAQFRVQRSLLNRLLALVGTAARPLLRRITNDNRHALVMWTFLGPFVSSSVYALVKLGVFENLKSGPKTANELADDALIHEQALYRILRALATIGYLKQNKNGTFELTPVSELVLKDHPESFQGMALLYGDVVVGGMQNFIEKIKTGESVVELAHGGKTFWQVLEEQPDTADSFDRQMSMWTQLHAATIVKSFDFSQARTIVDIGGGRGRMMSEILQANPQAQGIIFDRPEVVIGTRQQIKLAGLADRCECVGGNFFESVPQGADYYIIKHVLHDWDDEHAMEILRNVRKAAGPHSKLLVIEGLVEHNYVVGEFFRAWWDILQMTHTLGRSRTAAQMQGMLEQCGFQLDTIKPTSLTDVLILESHPVPYDAKSTSREPEPVLAY